MNEDNYISWRGIVAGILLPWGILNLIGVTAYYSGLAISNWLNVGLTLVILAIIYLLCRPGYMMFAKGLAIGYTVFIVFFIVALFLFQL